eukprot:10149072-Alexandrium_andersonii.AAC.1
MRGSCAIAFADACVSALACGLVALGIALPPLSIVGVPPPLQVAPSQTDRSAHASGLCIGRDMLRL